jgi:opacity protein-like surface antigen
MKKLVIMLAVAVVAGMAQAVTLKEGTKEIALSGNYDPETADNFNYSLQPGYGVFIADNFEIGALGLLNGSENATIYGVKAFAEYNFDVHEVWAPYVRAGAGWLGSTLDDNGGANEHQDTSVVTGAAGFKYFLTDNVAISTEVEYTYAADDIFVNDDKLEDDNIEFNLALRFYIP